MILNFIRTSWNSILNHKNKKAHEFKHKLKHNIHDSLNSLCNYGLKKNPIGQKRKYLSYVPRTKWFNFCTKTFLLAI